MQKFNEISAALSGEVSHYGAVAKKFVNWNAAGSSGLSAVFLSTGFGSALSVVALPVSIPLSGVGGAFALVSLGLIFASKKLDSKIKKHQEIVTLAITKRGTVDTLLSKTMVDNQITDGEFQLIMAEFTQYNVLKAAVRAKLIRRPSRPDVEKIRKDVRYEVEEEFRKKLDALAAASN